VLYLYDQPAVRSQSIYHAVAYEMGRDDPDTILITSPATAYVSIGFHQEAELELDLAACAARSLPVVRREVGGGAVYLDAGQVFCNWAFSHTSVPVQLADRYRLYVEPLVQTYRDFEIAASYRPINDVHVAGRKIGGTGAARIGECELLVGSLMFSFDFETMAAVLRVSSEKMRDKVVSALGDYMTTMERELGRPPERDLVVSRYLDHCSAVLGRPVVEGQLREEELERAALLDTLMSTPEYVYLKGAHRRSGVRIHAGVEVRAGDHKSRAGLIRVTAVVVEGAFSEVSISGDFTILPKEAIGLLEARLSGLAVKPAAIEEVVEDWFTTVGVDAPGLSPADLSAALSAAVERPIE